MGVLSQSEEIEGLSDLIKIDSAKKVKELIIKGTFSQYSPELLALNIIKEVR